MLYVAIAFVTLLVFIFLGFPIFLATLITGIVFLVNDGIPMQLIIIRMFGSINSLALMAIPFFVIAGNIIMHAGITEKIMDFANSAVGFMKGGLGHVNIFTSMLFAGKQGSGVADAAAVGGMLIPAMEKQGYSKEYSVAVTAASAMLSPIIPPSIAMILYAYATGLPVGPLFLGGIIPGILLTGFQMITNGVMYRRSGLDIPTTPFSIKNLLKNAWKALGALMMPAIILIGITTGIVSPTESGVLAILYGLFYGFVLTRKLKVSMLPKILLDSAVTSAVVMMTIAAAGVMGNVLVRMHFQAEVLNFAVYTIGNPVLASLFIMAVLIILGCFLDPTIIIAMFATTIFAVGNIFGYDAVHYAVVMVIVMQLGAITPPVGSFLFVACSVGNLPLERSIKPLLPYIGVVVLLILVIFFIPPLVTFLPSFM